MFSDMRPSTTMAERIGGKILQSIKWYVLRYNRHDYK